MKSMSIIRKLLKFFSLEAELEDHNLVYKEIEKGSFSKALICGF